MTLRTWPGRRSARTLGVALAALALVACGGTADDPADETASAPTSAPTASASPTATPDQPAESETAPETAPETESDDPVLEVVIEGSSISPNAAELAMPVGSSLTLQITSDREGEFHVHARPESYVPFGAGQTTHVLTFENPGTVEIEEHDTGFAIAVIEVR